MNKNRVVSFILLVALIISLAINTYTLTSHKDYSGNIVGTYCCGEEKDNGEYLTFRDDKTYIHYKQFSVLDEGNYVEDYENIYILNENEQSNEIKIIFIGDTIYYNNADNDIKVYKKLSNTPMLININNNQ